MIYRWIILFFLSVSLHAQEIAVSDKDLPKIGPQETPNDLILSSTKGIVLFSNLDDVNRTDVKHLFGFHTVNLKIPGGAAPFEKEVIRKWMDQPLTKPSLYALMSTIEKYFQKHGQPFVYVTLPRQDIASGVLSLLVLEGKLGEVRYVGNEWLKNSRLQEYIQLEPNALIDENALLQTVDFINRNPFRSAQIVYVAGKQPQTTDIELVIKERSPFRAYAGSDNMGLSAINRTRFFAGFNYANLFGADQILSYQFTISKDFKSYQSNTLSYVIPFAWQHVLELYGGFSRVESDAQYPFSKSKGHASQVSERYVIPLPYVLNFKHEVGLGTDYKRTNNTLEFIENNPVFGRIVNLTQLVLNYKIEWNAGISQTKLNLHGYWSPGQIIDHQSNADFNSLRFAAKNHWLYGRADLTQTFAFGRQGQVLIRASGQLSSQVLLPSEEFGLGGLNTVRGYEERTINGDQGFFGSVEVKFPAFNGIIKPRYNGRGILTEDLWQIILFCDYGIAWVKNNIVYQTQYIQNDQVYTSSTLGPKRQYLLGAGPGLRYQVGAYLFAQVDLGFKLHKNPSQWGGGWAMLHFAVTGGF